MSKYRANLSRALGRTLMTDGGMETTLIFNQGVILPGMAAFTLLRDEAGTNLLRRYYERYADLARTHGLGFVLESPTWRANHDWAEPLGYDERALADANRQGVGLMLEIRDRHEERGRPFLVSGNIGPRGDGYFPDSMMTAEQARAYHSAQLETFAGTDADLVSAFTLNYVDEAIGIVRAAREHDMPVVISFTVETDGRLPSGDTLADAIRRTDDATAGYAEYYMLNCAHPTHFASVLKQGGDWLGRLQGLRANASARSHAELDNSTELDPGNPEELGAAYRDLRDAMPRLRVVGGCCGTDHRHVDAICRHLKAPALVAR
jgi:S-methylmethionine-dependent homocysteine/selenocysteine methylase